MYFLYILECKDGSLYTGVTTNLERRFQSHKNGTGGRFTRSRGVKQIVYSEKYPNRSTAQIREASIKKWSRKKKLNLIKLN